MAEKSARIILGFTVRVCREQLADLQSKLTGLNKPGNLPNALHRVVDAAKRAADSDEDAALIRVADAISSAKLLTTRTYADLQAAGIHLMGLPQLSADLAQAEAELRGLVAPIEDESQPQAVPTTVQVVEEELPDGTRRMGSWVSSRSSSY